MKLFLLIGESLGWQELIMIGVIALIVFGPRKLPQLAKTIGKTMADFRRMTNEFRSTWEKEVDEDTQLVKTLGEDPLKDDEAIETTPPIKDEQKLLSPQVKELSSEEIERIFQKKETQPETSPVEEPQTETTILGKRDWL